MAIKDKDGKIYKLSGPNPLMQSQVPWDKRKVTLYNMEVWKSINLQVVGEPLPEPPTPIAPQAKVVKTKDFLEDIVAVEVPKPIEKPIVKPVEKPKPTLDTDIKKLLKERGKEYHCAPVIDTRTVVDSFYGSTFKRPVYGDKFVFQALVVESTELELLLWCVQEIQPGSIIYQKNYEGDTWWKVTETDHKSSGHLLKCNISNVNPDFS